MVIPLLSTTHPPYPIAHASSKTIYLVANNIGGYYYWNSSNPTITVTQGDTITLDLSSTTGTVSHTFWLDLDGDHINDLSDCSTTMDPCISTPFTTSQTLTFTVNNVGTYQYFCTIHYPAMTGSFVVQPLPQPDFSIASSPSSLGVIQGSAGNTTIITLSSLKGFAGTVSLTATPSQSGFIASFNPSSITLASGGSGTSIMTVSTSSTPPGFYSITVNGTSGSTTNATKVSITVTIPDFRLNPSPFSLSLSQGSAATTTITITSLSGFKGTLTLTGTTSPSGPSLSFNPASVTLPSGGSGTSIMTLSTNGSVGTGSYTVTVTVTNGTLTHSTTVPVTIASRGLPLTFVLLIGAGVGAAAIIGVAVFLLRRRRAMRA